MSSQTYTEQQANGIFHLGETKLASQPVVYSLSKTEKPNAGELAERVD